jgi:hypothetical protein
MDQRQQSEALRKKIEAQLDEALKATFPASDPVSIATSQQEEDWGGEQVPSSLEGAGEK